MIKTLLSLEGLVVMGTSIYLYFSAGSGLLMFLLLFLVPDLAMVGYLFNKNIGAKLYNIFHTYILPLALYVVGHLMSKTILTSIALIWIAHIGMDRLIGFGLKYETDFKDTHLQRLSN